MSNLIFIDDDTDLLDIHSRYFTKEGYHVINISVPEKAVNIIRKNPPDCIILDVMMPGTNGFELCQQIREVSDAPIIFLSGRITEQDKVRGLMSGGDDYITKPYSYKELSARIHAQIRRRLQTAQVHRAVLPPFSFDLALHKVYYERIEIPMSNREYELLYLLSSKPEVTISYKEIGERVWGTYSEADNSTIMVIASRLRKKLEQYTGRDNIFDTVRSTGYILHNK